MSIDGGTGGGCGGFGGFGILGFFNFIPGVILKLFKNLKIYNFSLILDSGLNNKQFLLILMDCSIILKIKKFPIEFYSCSIIFKIN